MKIKEMYVIYESLRELWDFFTHNSDSDETGLQEEMGEKYAKATKSIREEIKRAQVKNARKRIIYKKKKGG